MNAPADVIAGVRSLTSVIAIVNVCVLVLPTTSLACTSISTLGPVVSRSISAAVLTAPVFASIVNKPPPSFVSEYFTVLSIGSVSVECAVTPTYVPIAMFSSIESLVAVSLSTESVGAVVSMVMSRAVETALTLPATSVWNALTWWTPSPLSAMSLLKAPPLAVTVPSVSPASRALLLLASSNSVTVAPVSAAPLMVSAEV